MLTLLNLSAIWHNCWHKPNPSAPAADIVRSWHLAAFYVIHAWSYLSDRTQYVFCKESIPSSCLSSSECYKDRSSRRFSSCCTQRTWYGWLSLADYNHTFTLTTHRSMVHVDPVPIHCVTDDLQSRVTNCVAAFQPTAKTDRVLTVLISPPSASSTTPTRMLLINTDSLPPVSFVRDLNIYVVADLSTRTTGRCFGARPSPNP